MEIAHVKKIHGRFRQSSVDSIGSEPRCPQSIPTRRLLKGLFVNCCVQANTLIKPVMRQSFQGLVVLWANLPLIK